MPNEPTSRLHIVRTTVAAVLSFLVARLVTLPEPYWATISTLVAMQSSLQASWEVSRKRLIGTLVGAALGGALGGALSGFSFPALAVYASALPLAGLLCVLLRFDRVAYRYAAITLAIVLLIPHDRAPWVIAAHRCAEVSIGIAVALGLTGLWPERQAT